MILIGQRRLILGKKINKNKKRTILVTNADNGGGCACMGQEEYEKSLYLSLDFAANVKLL